MEKGGLEGRGIGFEVEFVGFGGSLGLGFGVGFWGEFAGVGDDHVIGNRVIT